MKIVTDTHTLFWYFLVSHNLSKRAAAILKEAEKIFIPTIVVLELFYLLNKLKLKDRYPSILKRIENSDKYIIVSLDMRVVKVVTGLSNRLEMHDRIVVATAKILSAPIITKDKVIQEVYDKTIW